LIRTLSRALVVGGAGFYGSWLVDALVAEGVAATVLDERPPTYLPSAIETVCADAAEVDLVKLLDTNEIDAIFQLAGSGLVPETLKRPVDDLRRNAVTTLVVLEAARAARRTPLVAFVSSAAVYGEAQRMPMAEDHPLCPVSPYGISKLAAERYVSLYASLYGLPTFSVRPFSLYGPRQRKLAIYDLLSRLVDGESPLLVNAAPEVSRDFVFVEDAARALVTLAASAPASGEAYNLASGQPTTLGELASLLIDAVGCGAEARFTGEIRPGDPIRWDGDPSLAAAFGAECHTSLAAGLGMTAAWVTQDRLDSATG
jgi:UDP-glucose 4-epimerase